MNRINFQSVADELCREYNLPFIKVEVKNTRCGRARTGTNKITIPKFAIGYGEAFSKYYIIHEMCHFIVKSGGHGEDFKTKERELLKSYNLIPVYSKAYAKKLYSLDSVLLWEKK